MCPQCSDEQTGCHRRFASQRYEYPVDVARSSRNQLVGHSVLKLATFPIRNERADTTDRSPHGEQPVPDVSHMYMTACTHPSYSERSRVATRILIVNNERPTAERCAAALKGRGYEVETAPSPLLAHHAAQREPPDVIMLDAVIALDREPGGGARRFTGDAVRRRIPIVLTKGAVHPPGFPLEEMARRDNVPVAAIVRISASPSELASAIEQARRLRTQSQAGGTSRGASTAAQPEQRRTSWPRRRPPSSRRGERNR